MKKYFILFIVFLIGCSSSKQVVKEDPPEKVIEDQRKQQPESKKAVQTNAAEKISQKSDIPEFKFSLVPADTFKLKSKNELLLVIIGEGTADISISWQDNTGNWKTVKKGSKSDKVYTIKYSADYVKKNIGTGNKIIKAEIMYDPDKSPVQCQQKIHITQGKSSQDTVAKGDEQFRNDYQELNMYFDDIYFDLGQYKTPSKNFNKNYVITLAKAIKALQQNDKIYLNLRGYTDPTGSPEINTQISRKRCETVGQLLLDLVPADEQKKMATRIFIMNMGVGDFLAPQDNKLKNQLNRRVSLTLADIPRGMSLLYALKKKDKDLSLSPKTVEQSYKSGLNYFYDKKFNEAKTIFKTIYEKYPKHALADNAQWWEAEILYVNKEYSQAIKLYNRVFGLGDGNKEAYSQYRVGCCYKEMGRNEKAISELQKVKKLYPTADEEWDKAQRMIKRIDNH
ncbi:MAG: tetratricopeptide repeat protein [Fidelibacterota bacterium]